MGFFDRLLGRPDPARFAAELIQALRQAGDRDELRFDAAGDRILRLRDGAMAGTINLGNLFRTYRQQPRSGRAACLRSLARGILAPHKGLPEEFDLARADLRPKVWSRSGLEQARLRAGLGEPSGGVADLPCEPVGEHLIASLAYDWPESVQSVGAEDLRRWGATLYEAMEVARRNLEEATVGYAQLGESLYAFLSGDSYDAARLLLVDRIQELEVAGRPIAMVPNRDSLLITGSEDEAGLAMLAELGAKGLQESYVLSGVPLILEEGAWADWMPPTEHPLHRRFRGLEANWLGPVYLEQKKLLDAAHQHRGIDIFTASFLGVRKKDGEDVSYCVWGDGVDSLLPVTQKVVFMQASREKAVALGDWARVVEVAGGLMEPTDHYPPRFRVRAFPDRAALEAIGLGVM
jgi:hypothetical protein